MRPEPTLIQSVQRALHLMEALAARNGRGTVKQLSRDTNIALPTAYHLVRTLAHEGYVNRLDDGSMVISARVADLASSSLPGKAEIRGILGSLRDSTGASVYFARFDGRQISIVEVVQSPRTPRIDVYVGAHESGHATAVGKAILAALPIDVRHDYLKTYVPQALTANTITELPVLNAQLDQIPQQRSVAYDHEEYAPKVSCVAAALNKGESAGAIGIAVSTRRLAREPELQEVVIDAAAKLERALTLANTQLA